MDAETALIAAATSSSSGFFPRGGDTAGAKAASAAAIPLAASFAHSCNPAGRARATPAARAASPLRPPPHRQLPRSPPTPLPPATTAADRDAQSPTRLPSPPMMAPHEQEAAGVCETGLGPLHVASGLPLGSAQSAKIFNHASVLESHFPCIGLLCGIRKYLMCTSFPCRPSLPRPPAQRQRPPRSRPAKPAPGGPRRAARLTVARVGRV